MACVFKGCFQNHLKILCLPWQVNHAKNLKSEVGFRLKCYLNSLDRTMQEIRSPLCMGCRCKNRALIIFENLQPALDRPPLTRSHPCAHKTGIEVAVPKH